MRTGLIAAVTRTANGELRAELPVAGRSVLAWQVALMRDLGVERILCLCEDVRGELLRLQHEVEAGGGAFHALKGFAALPALVRAGDDLIILRDGLVPDPLMARSLVEADPGLRRMVACLPSDHPLATSHPHDFERVDAVHHWAGLLVMRGAPVQQLADFPADADAVSVLLRLALQAGTPCHGLTANALTDEAWLLADSADAITRHEQAMIAKAAPESDWRAPLTTLAAVLVRKLAPRGLIRAPMIGAAAAFALLIGGAVTAALGEAAGGLALAALGNFAARLSGGFATLRQHLLRQHTAGRRGAIAGVLVDVLTAVTMWFALSPWPEWTPLAVCGPMAIGLARLALKTNKSALAAVASDRASQLLLLALAAAFGVLPEAVAIMALALLAALLLRKADN
ncbi:MAG: hypothetical protein U1D66_05705 [Erythrobacter sp.]|nr:hypothetical protein [Erythrobacter sp.]